jgi:hypothetical protein
MKFLKLLALLIVFAVSIMNVATYGSNGFSIKYVEAEGDLLAPDYSADGWSTQPAPSGGSQGLRNPLRVSSIEELLELILDIVVTFSVPIIVFFLIYSGFLYVMAQGKPDKIKTATTAFTWTIIGGVIVLGASVILTVITNTVKSLQ